LKISEKKNNKPFGKLAPVILILALLGIFVFAFKGKIEHTKEKVASKETGKNPAEIFEGSTFNIAVSSDAYRILSAKRDEAIKRGLLFTSKDDLVDADIKIDGKEYACKLRLKGDLLDHLSGERWSFRIMLKGNQEWNGMNTFSIHNSKARSHTAEWLMHELFRQEGILVPAYDFIKVQLNGKDLGVYAYEHHFEDQMLEKNGRGLGPILKHNDDAYWENVHKKLKPFPWIEASQIELFNKEYIKDPAFKQSFDIAHSMLNDFVQEKTTASEVFDIDLMAKYFAMLDLSHAWHAAQFTNIRFYLNNFTGKLEPIAFDCFGDHMPNVTADWLAYGESFNNRTSKDAAYARSDVYKYLMFQDITFYEVYMKYLDKYTDPKILNQFRNEYAKSLESRVKFINTDNAYKDYKPDWETIFGKAFFTRKKLDAKPDMSLKAFRVNNSAQEISMESYHYFPLQVLGFGNENEITFELPEPVIIEAYNSLVPIRRYEYAHTQEIEYIYYGTLGLKGIHKIKVSKSSVPLENVETQQFNLEQFVSLPFVDQVGDEIKVASGRHKINFPVILPEDKILKISAGTEIEFTKNGCIYSKSPIIARGSKSNPIKIFSDGNKGSGILITDVKVKSIFTHCLFEGLSDYKSKNVTAKGAVNIYRSEAEFSNCQFYNIKSREALSMWYSEVKLEQCFFRDCLGTAINSKYSSSDIIRCDFTSIGKNGISAEKGSTKVSESNFREILNRALDFGDNAKVYGQSNSIFDSYQSLYVTNQADVRLVKFWNENITRGLEVRGQENTPPKVDIEQFKFKNIKTLYLIEQGFYIMVNGKRELG